MYYAFEKYRANPIRKLQKGGLSNIFVVTKENEDFYSLLRKIIDIYGAMSDIYLSNLTHEHKAWKDSDLYLPIKEKLIQETFEKLEYGK